MRLTFFRAVMARHVAAVERYTITETVFGRPSRYRGCRPELADGLENVLAFIQPLLSSAF
jgi:hypothetical protein